MKELKYFVIIGLLLVAFITNAQKPRYLKTDTYEGVVFHKYWATYPKYYFSPTDKEIAVMEKKLPGKIGELLSNFEKKERSVSPYNSVRHCDFVEDLGRFKRQYCGHWIKGDKVIMAQFFIDVPSDWKKVMIIPGELSGNRSCKEFGITYSITSGKFCGFFEDTSPM